MPPSTSCQRPQARAPVHLVVFTQVVQKSYRAPSLVCQTGRLTAWAARCRARSGVRSALSPGGARLRLAVAAATGTQPGDPGAQRWGAPRAAHGPAEPGRPRRPRGAASGVAQRAPPSAPSPAGRSGGGCRARARGAARAAPTPPPSLSAGVRCAPTRPPAPDAARSRYATRAGASRPAHPGDAIAQGPPAPRTGLPLRGGLAAAERSPTPSAAAARTFAGDNRVSPAGGTAPGACSCSSASGERAGGRAGDLDPGPRPRPASCSRGTGRAGPARRCRMRAALADELGSGEQTAEPGAGRRVPTARPLGNAPLAAAGSLAGPALACSPAHMAAMGCAPAAASGVAPAA